MKQKKKAWFACVFLAAFLWISAVPVFAAGDPSQFAPDRWGNGLDYVTDQGNFLTDNEEASLSRQAAELTKKYNCTVYIVTMDDFKKYTVGRTMENCSDDIREGYGLDGDLIMLLLSVNKNHREFHLMAYGDFANASFTDYGKETMLDAIEPKFKKQDWNGGCEVYLEQCDRLLALSVQGKPLDISQWEIVRENLADMGKNCVYALTHFDLKQFLCCSLVGALFALIFTSIASSKLESVKRKEDAKDYIIKDSLTVTERYDQYTHTTTTTRDAPNSHGKGGSGGGGRGGTTVNSRGSSHAGRSF